MNTALQYVYRDGSNYKLNFDEVLLGSVPEETIKRFNEENEERFFIPQ